MIAAFRRGVRFECSRCGKCCSSLSSQVQLTLAEARRISARLGLSLAEFLKRRCRVSLHTAGDREHSVEVPTITLKTTRAGHCPFLTGSGECGIHEVKPLFCAHAPFVRDVADGGELLWQAIAASCPGVGSGSLYRPSHIKQMLRREKALARDEFLEIRRDEDDARLVMRSAQRSARSKEER